MISKTIGFRGTQHFQTHPQQVSNEMFQIASTWPTRTFDSLEKCFLYLYLFAIVCSCQGHDDF